MCVSCWDINISDNCEWLGWGWRQGVWRGELVALQRKPRKKVRKRAMTKYKYQTRSHYKKQRVQKKPCKVPASKSDHSDFFFEHDKETGCIWNRQCTITNSIDQQRVVHVHLNPCTQKVLQECSQLVSQVLILCHYLLSLLLATLFLELFLHWLVTIPSQTTNL